MTQQLLEVAERAVRVAERLGAQQAEAYVASARSFAIEVEDSAIKSASERRDAGCGIRCVIGKKIGFAYVTTIQDDDVDEAVGKSIGLARASIPDKDFVSLPYTEPKYPIVRGLFDGAIEQLNPDEAADLIVRTVDTAKESLAQRRYAIEAQLSVSSGVKAVVNSLGVSRAAKTTFAMIESGVMVKEEGDQTSSYEYQVSRELKGIDPEWVGRTSSESALRALGSKTIQGGEMSVVFGPLAVSTIIGSGFAGAINAEEVQYGRSYISDAIGSEIASERLNIVDDGLLKGGIGSRAFDAEGARSQRTEILQGGVLKSLLHSSYTANKVQVANTANAYRPSYAGVPSIGSSNFMVMPGSGTLDDLVSEVKRGVLCRNTWDRPNMTTGDLSAMVSEGFYIEDGELKHSVKNTLIGINMRDLLKKVSRVGADTRVTGSMVTPSIVIESAKITSG